MYATQQSSRPVMGGARSGTTRPKPQPNLQQERRRAQLRQQSQVRRQQQITELTREAVVKIAVNGLLISVAAAALVKLVPSHFYQQAQLKDIEQELDMTQERVSRLKSDFNQSFDPAQAKSVMVQQSYRVDPEQKAVVLVQPGSTGTTTALRR
jgi:hypothetical protein